MRKIRVLLIALHQVSLPQTLYGLHLNGYLTLTMRDMTMLKLVDESYCPDVILLQSVKPDECIRVLNYFQGKTPVVLLTLMSILIKIPSYYLHGVETPGIHSEIINSVERASRSVRDDILWFNEIQT